MGKINKKLHKLGRVALACVVAFSAMIAPDLSVNTLATTTADFDQLIAEYEKKAEDARKDIEKLESEIDGLTGDLAENEDAIALIEQQISNYEDEIENYGNLITTTQQKISTKEQELREKDLEIYDKEIAIEQTRAEIVRLEEENDANLKKFAKLIRALYMNDASDSMPVLNGSDDWYDFFVYVDVVQSIGEQNM
ncbi:MAG: hypothetical protein J6K92_13280, partial [Oscillospiraceae bacterium]|nr:hypothetical protein [Oscillospiraceae bacterium]